MNALASYAAIGLLVAGAAVAGSGDYILILPTGEQICAKSSEVCETARVAIRKGWWPILDKDVMTVCQPRPECFSEQSNHIRGYN